MEMVQRMEKNHQEEIRKERVKQSVTAGPRARTAAASGTGSNIIPRKSPIIMEMELRHNKQLVELCKKFTTLTPASASRLASPIEYLQSKMEKVAFDYSTLKKQVARLQREEQK